jgi:hypothetical protein
VIVWSECVNACVLRLDEILDNSVYLLFNIWLNGNTGMEKGKFKERKTKRALE